MQKTGNDHLLFWPFKWATLDLEEILAFTSYVFCFFDQNFPGVTIYENYLVEVDDMRVIIENEKESGLEIPVSGRMEIIFIMDRCHPDEMDF